MKKKTFIPLILILIIFKGYSQQSNKLNFEGGMVINKPLIKSERLKSIDNAYSEYSADWTYKYYSSSGYFIKFSYDSKLISKKKWSLFVPVGISLMTQITKFHRQGSGGGIIVEVANELKTIYDKNANLFFGPLLQFENKKIRCSSSILLNNCLTFYSRTHSSPNNLIGKKDNSDFILNFNLYISSKLSILYNIKNNLWLGFSNEIFYGNGLYFISKNNYPIHDPSIKITGKNIWINPAIKLQLDLN